MFTDYTEVLNQSLRPELRRLALYLKGDRADLTVKGDGNRWLVVLYENAGFESRMIFLWHTATRDLGVRLARHLQELLEAARPDDDLIALIPSGLQDPALGRELVPEDLIPA